LLYKLIVTFLKIVTFLNKLITLTKKLKELTKKVKAELSGKFVEDRRRDLTDLHQTGYNIRPYLKEMLTYPNNREKQRQKYSS